MTLCALSKSDLVKKILSKPLKKNVKVTILHLSLKQNRVRATGAHAVGKRKQRVCNGSNAYATEATPKLAKTPGKNSLKPTKNSTKTPLKTPKTPLKMTPTKKPAKTPLTFKPKLATETLKKP